jgi:hypothetical protein
MTKEEKLGLFIVTLSDEGRESIIKEYMEKGLIDSSKTTITDEELVVALASDITDEKLDELYGLTLGSWINAQDDYWKNSEINI